MQKSAKTPFRSALKIAVIFVPWVISMYTLYWLEYGEIWTTGTPHRGKASVAILITGMTLSFLVYSYFARREQE